MNDTQESTFPLWSSLSHKNGETVRPEKQSSFELEGHPMAGQRPALRFPFRSVLKASTQPKKPLKEGIPRLFRVEGSVEAPSGLLDTNKDSMEGQTTLLGRALKLPVQPGQSLFGALVLENSRKGPARLHRTNLET
jgi:hypothetical protein